MLPGGEGMTLAALVFAVILFCGLPMALVAKLAFTGEAGFSAAPFLEALASRSVRQALWNSLESGLLSALCATVVGTVLALLFGLTDIRRKGPLIFMLLLPMMIPPHVTAISWIQALGPSSPVLAPLGLAPPPGTANPLYSLGGLVGLLTLQHAPLTFLIVRAALRALPSELVEAARLSGGGPVRVLLRVILPLILPSMIAAFALAFVSALGNFGINALIGIPARYTTLPVLIFQRLSSFGPSMLANVAVIACVLGLVAIAATILQALAERGRRFSLVGPPQKTLAIRLGASRPMVETGLWLLVGATVALPLAALIGTALVPVYGVPLNLDTVTLRNFSEILFSQQVTIRAFVNSTLLAATAALLLAVLSIGLGHFLNRDAKARVVAGVASGLADLAYALPGLVLAVGFILAFIRPLPGLGISLYNTHAIILIAYCAAFLAVALKPVAAAYGQLDPNLDAAARLTGAGYLRRMRLVAGPLVAPAAASGALLVFLTAYNEVTVSALLWSSGKETIGTTIFNYEQAGYPTLSAAMATVTVVVTLVVMLALNGAARRLPAGVVPWRD